MLLDASVLLTVGAVGAVGAVVRVSGAACTGRAVSVAREVGRRGAAASWSVGIAAPGRCVLLTLAISVMLGCTIDSGVPVGATPLVPPVVPVLRCAITTATDSTSTATKAMATGKPWTRARGSDTRSDGAAREGARASRGSPQRSHTAWPFCSGASQRGQLFKLIVVSFIGPTTMSPVCAPLFVRCAITVRRN